MSTYNQQISGLWEAAHHYAAACDYEGLLGTVRAIIDLAIDAHPQIDWRARVPARLEELLTEYVADRKAGFWPASGHFKLAIDLILRHNRGIEDSTEQLFALLGLED